MIISFYLLSVTTITIKSAATERVSASVVITDNIEYSAAAVDGSPMAAEGVQWQLLLQL